MRLSSDCIFCLLARQQSILKEYGDEERKRKYLQAVLRHIADAGENASAPVVLAGINRLQEEHLGFIYDLSECKAEYNKLLLEKEASIASQLNNSGDRLLGAIQLAIAGNYIDFGAADSVDKDKLERLLDTAPVMKVDPGEYAALRSDLAQAGRLAYLTDNCGEIVLDKLLIRTLRALYQRLHVTVITRGKPVLSDATAEDAAAVGLPAVAEVLGNGTDVAGTPLDRISGEARRRIVEADVIISKGQGNFETLHGCGLNIYYLFLCKCELFTRRFNLALHKGILINERNVAPG